MDENQISEELHEAEVKVVDPRVGLVELTIIRAGRGNKRNRHYYSAKMLEANAHKYAGVGMYDNHDTPAKARERGGMPRPASELVGAIRESWYDPNVKDASGKVVGGIRGRAILMDPKMVTIARHAPSLLGASHNATASRVKTSVIEGEQLLEVEGIHNVDSVDIVTQAGAGGQVERILESHMEDDMAGPLDKLTLDDLTECRPDLLEAYVALQQGKGGDGGNTADADKEFDAKLQEAVTTAVAEAVSETEARLNAEHERELQVRDNRIEVAKVLGEADLPQKSRDAIARQFEDSFYEPKAVEDGEDISPAAQLAEALQAAITEKQDELAEATGSGKVKGMGLSEGGAAQRKTKVHDAVVGHILRPDTNDPQTKE